jgi:hypothetical protein
MVWQRTNPCHRFFLLYDFYKKNCKRPSLVGAQLPVHQAPVKGPLLYLSIDQ